MTDTEKLALAMEAIEAADKILDSAVPPVSRLHNEKFCVLCRRWIIAAAASSHGENCPAPEYLELRKKLEAANG